METLVGAGAPSGTELVWDRGELATAASATLRLPTGSDAEWTPGTLLATAAAASLLTTFLELARGAGVPILGYVSRQRPHGEAAGGAVTSIAITACVSVASPAAVDAVRGLWGEAMRLAPVLKTLTCPVVGEPSIVAIGSGDDGEE